MRRPTELPHGDRRLRGAVTSVVVLLLMLMLTLASVGPTLALDNGLALRPPMGWLAWERYVCETNCAEYPDECIDYNLFSAMARRMAEDGFKSVGYEYVNIDDCWSLRRRDAQSRALVADPKRFPSIGKLADEIHALGLKLGIYGDCGTETCQGFPGQLKYADNLTDNYYELDANTFADWRIDSFKFDGCNLNVTRAAHLCPLMGAALNSTGRPMLFSCSWPAYENDANLPTDWQLVADMCNLWRAFGDIEDSWRSVIDTIDYFVKRQDLVLRFHGPGHWFDADQLVLGNFGLSEQQEEAQMAIWCLWSSPLYMSNDLRNISKRSSELLRNKLLIQVNQDKFGVFGQMVAEQRQVQAFVKPVEPEIGSTGCPSYALVYLDRRTLGNGRLASFKLLDLVRGLHAKLARVGRWSRWSHCAEDTNRTFDAIDLLAGGAKVAADLRLANDSLKLRVDPSGVRAIKLVHTFQWRAD